MSFSISIWIKVLPSEKLYKQLQIESIRELYLLISLSERSSLRLLIFGMLIVFKFL